MSGMKDAFNGMLGKAEERPIKTTVLATKTAVGMNITFFGDYANLGTKSLHFGNIIFNMYNTNDRFLLSSEDEFTTLELGVISMPEDLSWMGGSWEFKIMDNAGELIFKKSPNVPAVDRIVRYRDDVKNAKHCANYFLEESPSCLTLINPADGQEISLFSTDVIIRNGDKEFPYRRGLFTIEHGNAFVWVMSSKENEPVLLEVRSGISINIANTDSYIKLASAIMGKGSPDCYGMIFCNVFHLDPDEVGKYNDDTLRAVIAQQVSYLLGMVEFNGNPSAAYSQQMQREVIFPIVFGTVYSYTLLRDNSWDKLSRVELLGDGVYVLYNENGDEVYRGGCRRLTSGVNPMQDAAREAAGQPVGHQCQCSCKQHDNDATALVFDIRDASELHLLSDRVVVLYHQSNNPYTYLYQMLSGQLWDMGMTVGIDTTFMSMTNGDEYGNTGLISVNVGDIQFQTELKVPAVKLTMNQYVSALKTIISDMSAYQAQYEQYINTLTSWIDWIRNHSPIYKDTQFFAGWTSDWESTISGCYHMATQYYEL